MAINVKRTVRKDPLKKNPGKKISRYLFGEQT